MSQILNNIPAECWAILAVALAGLLLLIGIRIVKHGLYIRKGNMIIELEEVKEEQNAADDREAPVVGDKESEGQERPSDRTPPDVV